MGLSLSVDGYFGDGGKGQKGSILAQIAYAVIRAGGANNSGQKEHTGKTRHNLPIGMDNDSVKYGIIGSGCLVNPATLQDEFRMENGELDPNILRKLKISDRAEILLESHIHRDIKRETSGNGVGSTRRGVSPATQDRGFKIGLRFWHLNDPQLTEHQIKRQLEESGLTDEFDPHQMAKEVIEQAGPIMHCVDNTSVLITDLLDQGKNIHIGGHQGALLDWIHGTVPCTTSMDVTAPGMLAMLGIGLRPAHVNMIVKANPTRVGAGPQVAEIVDYELLNNEVLDFICDKAEITREQLTHMDDTDPIAAGDLRKRYAPEFQLTEDELWIVENSKMAHAYATEEHIDQHIPGKESPRPYLNKLESILGNIDPLKTWFHIIGKYETVQGREFGATSGRPRRAAALDEVALDHAKRINNPNVLAVTKLDVLAGVQPLPICKGYKITLPNGETYETDVFPANMRHLENAEPVFDWLEGFKEDITGCRSMEDLPKGAKEILTRLEKKLKVPVEYTGVGTKIEQALLGKPLEDFYL